MMERRTYTWVLVLCCVGCGASAPSRVTTPRPVAREVFEMEEMRITAQRSEDGNYQFDSYDAEQLFLRANDLLQAQQC